MTVLFLEHSWWPIVGTESGPSDWRLLRWAPEGCAFTLSPSVLYLSSLLWTKDLGGAQTLRTRVICLPGWAPGFLGADPRLLVL